MTRRELFGLLAAAALDPERLVWTPGRKLISIPALLYDVRVMGRFDPVMNRYLKHCDVTLHNDPALWFSSSTYGVDFLHTLDGATHEVALSFARKAIPTVPASLFDVCLGQVSYITVEL